MTRIELMLLMVFAVGVALLLGEVRVLRRAPLTERLRPYAPPATTGSVARITNGTAGITAVLTPIAEDLGRRLGKLTGVRTELALRLVRSGRTEDPATFRLRQFTRTLVGLAAGGAVALALRPPPLVSLLLVIGVPLLVALGEEQRLEHGAAMRAEMIDAELPVVAEQLGVLLAAGLSLNAALGRLAHRGHGVVAEELAAVVRRVRQGCSENEALREWSERAQVDGVERLVSVLALHREAADLGALISQEAQAIRAAGHRCLVESIERRAQLVWVPVTVATLVPGLILIGVPFVAAMGRLSG